jgi:WD40 repeat protein
MSSKADDEQENSFLDPNETLEEYSQADDPDFPMSDEDDEPVDFESHEIIVDESIQGFFLHTSPIYSVALHNDWAATGGGDDLGYVWDVTNGEMIMKLDGHTDTVSNIRFSHDGTYLATGGMDGFVRIWSVQDKKLITVLEAGDEVVVCLFLYLSHCSGWTGILLDLLFWLVLTMEQSGCGECLVVRQCRYSRDTRLHVPQATSLLRESK